jgi:hypothetical protein
MIWKKKVIIIVSVIYCLIMFLNTCQPENTEIRDAVRAQLKRYPESSLQDIYKSFFQDEYGPGHLLEYPDGAMDYFYDELSGMVSRANYEAEPCGLGRNFYRVPMDLVKDGKISDTSYFAAFIESASSFSVPEIISWKQKWEEIVNIIENSVHNIPNFEADRKALAAMLDSGEAVVHHSRSYIDRYDPHYRIMGKVQWEKLKGSLNGD